MQKKRTFKDLIVIRIVATLLVLLSLILPYFGFMSHSTAPYLILAILVGFFIMEDRLGKKIVSE